MQSFATSTKHANTNFEPVLLSADNTVCWACAKNTEKSKLIYCTPIPYLSTLARPKLPRLYLQFTSQRPQFYGGVAVGRQANWPTGNWPTKLANNDVFIPFIFYSHSNSWFCLKFDFVLSTNYPCWPIIQSTNCPLRQFYVIIIVQLFFRSIGKVKNTPSRGTF